ncbi:MAG TPA: Fe-S cluster assembly protein SufD [Rhodocyclaceae bacterium]
MNAIVADRFSADFVRLKPQLPGVYVPWLAELREEAFADFLDKGFPSTRDEDWKYTSVAPIEKARFAIPRTVPDVCTDLGCVGTQTLPGAQLLVFVDGRHAPELSRLGRLPAGVTVASVAAMLEREPERLREALTMPRDGYASGFAALNTAFLADGAYIDLAPGADLEEPLHLLFVTATPNTAAHVRNLVVAGAGSRMRIIEHHTAVDETAYFINTATLIRLARGATVEHHKLQEESEQAFHIADVRAELGPECRFSSSSFALGGALSRTGIDVRFDGERSECSLDGLYLTDGRQLADHHTRIDHASPGCRSREFYKGVLDGASRGVFNGRVIVRPGAQRTDAQQTNRNLLLSEQAEADTKPQLEIWADDVKCAHGATVGQLDADQLFYLRARGIDDKAARAMLVYGFAAEMIERIALLPLRTRLERLLRQRLGRGAGALA